MCSSLTLYCCKSSEKVKDKEPGIFSLLGLRHPLLVSVLLIPVRDFQKSLVKQTSKEINAIKFVNEDLLIRFVETSSSALIFRF